MALNYQRVGWEDAPSTNTPLDAANLNHMDNGIVALSNEFDRVIPGLEEIAETVAPLLPNMSTMTQDINALQGQTSALATQAQHILGNFATVEEGETASANYSTGQHVVLGDYLYKVIDDIAQGESFVENTNIEKTTVGSEVEGLKSEIENSTPVLLWSYPSSGYVECNNNQAFVLNDSLSDYRKVIFEYCYGLTGVQYQREYYINDIIYFTLDTINLSNDVWSFLSQSNGNFIVVGGGTGPRPFMMRIYGLKQ